MNQNKQNNILLVSSNSAFAGIELSNEKLDSLFNLIHNLDLHKKTELGKQVAQWMDCYPGYPMAGGFGHRILHGHSFSDVSEVFDKFGIKGVKEWITHNALDLTSKHGLPIPFAKEIYELIPGVSINDAVEWLCFNITDLLAAACASTSIFALYQDNRLPSRIGLDGLIKTACGILTGNPVLIIIGSATILSSVIGFAYGEEVDEINLLLENFSNISGEINSIRLDPIKTEFEGFTNI